MPQSKVVAASLVVVIDLVLVVVAVTTFLGAGSSPTATAMSTRHGTSRVTTKLASSRTSTPEYHPLRVAPPETAVERTVNQALSQNLGSKVLDLLGSSVFPAPATSAPFRGIEVADSASASLFATAFTQELLDVNFATSSRQQLLAWANDNNAPFSFGDLPSALSTKVLCVSLTTGPSPVPSATEWNVLAASRTSWSVSGLVVSVNPAWTQALSAGWEPVDPLMEIDDVSGILTVSTPGYVPVVESITFALTLGGASLHPGYGAVALDDWTVD
jgi:hypothetical protein